MKEFIVRIPESESEMVSHFLLKIGAEIKEISHKRKLKKKDKPLDFFGKWKTINIDAVQLRKNLWERSSNI